MCPWPARGRGGRGVGVSHGSVHGGGELDEDAVGVSYPGDDLAPGLLDGRDDGLHALGRGALVGARDVGGDEPDLEAPGGTIESARTSASSKWERPNSVSAKESVVSPV